MDALLLNLARRTRTRPGHRSRYRLESSCSLSWRLLPARDCGCTSERATLPARRSPGSGGWAVAVDDLGLVRVPRGGRPVRVQDHGPALLVDDHLVVEEAEQGAVGDAGRAAVGLVAQVVHLAAGRGLVAAAGEPAVLVAQDHRAADRGRDVPGYPDVERQAGPAQPRPQLPAAQERGQAAGPGQQAGGLADDRLHQRVLRTRGIALSAVVV